MKERKSIYFRVDANQVIGTGHVMRCLSIAEQLIKYEVEIAFVVADETTRKIFLDKGWKCICLNSTWNNLEQELDNFCDLICLNEVDIVIVDSYYVTSFYLRKINCHTRVYYIDDLNCMEYLVDGIINYNIYGENEKYTSQSECKLILGPRYAPLRAEFSGAPQRRYDGIKSILITSGGTDEYDVVGHVLQHLLCRSDCAQLDYYCVLGRFNKNIEKLKIDYEEYQNVHFLINIDNISYYMKNCSLAISAGGTTCYELCACGIPTIVYTLADNQVKIALTFDKKEIMTWVGDVRKTMEECMDRVVDEIIRMKNKNLWEEKSSRMQRLVDGNGASRIAKTLITDIGF